jgi:hypothetical protein
MGSGGGCDECEEPAATEEALFASEAATEETMNTEPVIVTVEVAPQGTDTVRIAETPTAKEVPEEATAQESAADTAEPAEAQQEPPASFNWTLAFLVIALLSGAIMFIMRQAASRTWR